LSSTGGSGLAYSSGASRRLSPSGNGAALVRASEAVRGLSPSSNVGASGLTSVRGVSPSNDAADSIRQWAGIGSGLSGSASAPAKVLSGGVSRSTTGDGSQAFALGQFINSVRKSADGASALSGALDPTTPAAPE
jgi:hypothetical protein